MDGLAAIGSRIAEINAQLARLSAPAVTSVASTRSGTATATTNGSAAGTTGASTFAEAKCERIKGPSRWASVPRVLSLL